MGTTSSTYKNAPDIAGKAYFRLYETYDSYCKKAGVSSSSLNDAAVFAIKITPSTSDLSFRYFFASNEYNQPPYYNDTFALWVVQDFNGTNEKWNNIAKIPEDRMPKGTMSNEVNIQNTCPGNINNYKNDIPGIYKYNDCQNIGYLGCTEALDAEIDTLTPGQPVWVVMAVGDARDQSHDSAVFIKAKSIKFAKASDVSITYDADGGTFSGGETKAVRNVPSKSSYTVGEGMEAPARTGYIFDGWYTAGEDGQKVQGSITAETDTVYLSLIHI